MRWKYFLSVIFLASFLFLQSTFLYSLSEEEKQILPDLSKSVLVQIILTYDQGLVDSEKTILHLNESLTQLKQLQEQDSRELKIQEDLFQKSLQLQKEKDREAIIEKIIIGISGLVIGRIIWGAVF